MGKDATSESQIPKPAPAEGQADKKRRRTTRKKQPRIVLTSDPVAEAPAAEGEKPKPKRKRKRKDASTADEGPRAHKRRVRREREPKKGLISTVVAALRKDRLSIPPRGSMRPTRVHRRRILSLELGGLMFMFAGGIMLLALLTFHKDDPGFSSAGGAVVHNWVGPFGAFLADGATLLFGIGAYFFPLALITYGAMMLKTYLMVPRQRHFIGAALAGIGGMTLLEVMLGTQDLPFPAGGLVGVLFSALLMPLLFPVGTGLVSTFALLLGGFVCIDRPLVVALHDAGVWIRARWDQLVDRIEVYKEEQRLLREERARLEWELRAGELDDDGPGRHTRVRLKADARAKEKLRQELPAAIDEASRSNVPELSEEAEYPAAPGPRIVAPAAPPPAPADDEAEPTPRARKRARGDDPAWARPSVVTRLPGLGTDVSDAAPGEAEDDVVHAPTDIDPDAPTAAPSRRPQPAADPGPSADDNAAAEKAAEAANKPSKKKPKKTDDEGLVIVERDDDKEVSINDDDAFEAEAETPFELPPLKLLDYDAPDRVKIDQEVMYAEADKLVRKFADFGIKGRVREVRPGPVVTTYEFVPAPGIKVSRIAALSDDIAMAMEAVHVRIVAPIPGKGAVGIEIPNESRETVFLKEIIASDKFKEKADQKLMMALGKDIEGRAYTADLSAMPHVLISGTTGSGKSVSVNAMICSLLYRATPEEVKFLMIDPKMLELSIYDGIPHLLLPPIIDSKKAANALMWAVGEMERRYKAMSELGVRDITGYNEVIADVRAGTDPQKRTVPLDDKGKPLDRFPFIVIVVDEYADLLAIAGKEVEGYVMRLAQKARAAGIHVMLATQRPSVDVITGVIKANFPVRMGFRLASSHDSKTIINRPGAEKLLGRGDMLIMPPGTSNVTRVHGAFISEKELHRVVGFLKEQGTPDYDMSIVDPPTSDGGDGDDGPQERDDKWDEAIRVVARSRKCSTSWLQRQLGIGYNRAARIVEMMEREGLVGPQLSAKGDRDIFVPPSAGD